MPESFELIPQHGDPKAGYRVFTILAEIIQDKSNLGLPKKWNRNYELSRNKHWAKSSDTISLMTANLLYTHRQRTVNMLTDNNPTFNIVKRGAPEEDEKAYSNLLHVADFWWGDTEQQSVLEKSVQNGETYGCTIEKVVFNPDLEYNLGDVETELVDPYHFGFYPVNSKDIQKAEAIFHYWPMTVREAKRRWPEFTDDITSDEEFLEELNDTRREVAANTKGQPKGYFSTFSGVVKNMLNMAGDSSADSEELLICECWVKDYTEEDGKPKYVGNIRTITTCNGGKIVLEDRSNPSISDLLNDEEAQKTYLYDKYPFSLTQSITDTSFLWGVSDYEQLENLQIEVNKTLTQFTLFKDKVTGFKFINPKTSGVSNSEITNRKGILNPSNDQAAQTLRYIDPPKMPADLLSALNLYKEMFFLISGSFELEAAQSPGKEVIAYKAIAALIEHASNMLKGKKSNYGRMVRERGRMFISHVMNFYTEDRWITVEEDGVDEQRVINGTQLRIPAKLTIVSGSMMLRSKVVEREEALALFERGAIDDQELLKRMGWPATQIKELIKRKQAGPFGELFEKFANMGIPQELLQLFHQIAQMDGKDFQKSIEKGEIPAFAQIVQSLQGEQPPEDPMKSIEVEKAAIDIQKTNADMQQISADIQKTMTEVELLKAKIEGEYVEQEVRKAGVGMDTKKLEIETAEMISNIEERKKKAELETARLLQDVQSARQKSVIESKKVDNSKFEGKAIETKTQGAYREQGLKSNNKEP